MQEVTKLNDRELEDKIVRLIQDERLNLCEQLQTLLEIKRRRIPQSAYYFNLGDYCRRYLGLSKNIALKRSQAVNAIEFHPELLGLIERGETTISNLSLLAPHITQANKKQLLEFLPGATKRDLEFYLKRLTNTGELLNIEPELELRINVTKAIEEKLRLAQALLGINKATTPDLGDVLDAALETFLDKRDPARKSARAKARIDKKLEMERSADMIEPDQKLDSAPSSDNVSESSVLNINKASISHGSKDIVKHSDEPNPWETPGIDTRPVAIPQGIQSGRPFQREYISAKTRHEVFSRDQNRCTYVYRNTGERCDEVRFLQIDHVKMVCRGGTNDPSNLRVRCAGHNRMTAENDLGKSWAESTENRIRVKSVNG